MTDKKPYSEMPPIRAALQKWSDGQDIHGREFVGDPLAHFYEEQIDAFNYLAVLEERGVDVSGWRFSVEELLDEVWTALQEQNVVATKTRGPWVGNPLIDGNDAGINYDCCKDGCGIIHGRHLDYGFGYRFHMHCSPTVAQLEEIDKCGK